MTGELLSVQVGPVRHHVTPKTRRVDYRHPNWTSGIYKFPVTGPVRVTSAQIDGDAQHDLENHGGPDNVVLAYDAEHYPFWRDELSMPDLPFGGFGENFTVRGFSDATVCIGDTWRVGNDVLLQVTQARQPCYKLARRLSQPHIVKRIHENSWGGWYFRVLHEGMVEAGMRIEMTERPHPEWTVADAVQTMYGRKKDVARAQSLATIPALSRRWKEELLGD